MYVSNFKYAIKVSIIHLGPFDWDMGHTVLGVNGLY
jgi:hypothetical protein